VRLDDEKAAVAVGLGERKLMLRVAVVSTHPTQHFGPLFRAIAESQTVQLRVFYCSDLGARQYYDVGFDKKLQWDVDLLSGYDWEFLPLHRRPQKLGFCETNNATVGEALAGFSPDLILLFGYGHVTTWRALLWARSNGVRVLVFCDSELKHTRSLWRIAIKQLVVRLFFSLVDGGLPIGDCNAEYFKHYGVPDDRLFWTAYPVNGRQLLVSSQPLEDRRQAVRRKYGIAEDDFVFVSCGKYIPRKRHGDVLQAWKAFPTHLKARSAVLLVGEGPERSNLERLAAQAGGRVALTGFVNQSEVGSYYAAADALVVASDFDAHPLVVTEALFFGLPIVASDMIGCIGEHDTLREGQTGLVYRCGDIRHLAAAMERLMIDKPLRERLAAGAREIAAEQDLPTTAAKFASAFERAAEFAPKRSLWRRWRARRLQGDLGSDDGSSLPV
jgi:glycosyltransferase involved in cell wall biosynthesis